MPLSAIAELPLRFSESCQGTAAFTKIASDGGVLAEREFKPNGVKMLFAIVLPPYQAFFSKPRLQGLKSFDGLKVRSSGGAKEIVVRKLGAVPIQMATPEVYEALSRGTIDGTLFPFSSIYSYDLQGLVKQATVGENFGSFLITYMISNRRWATLPPEIQKVFNEVGQETSRLGCQVSQEGDGTDRDRLKAQGVELFSFNNADKQAIQAAMATVNTEWAQALDKRAKPGTAVLQAFEEALK
jgi:TRAP-type C4-dicarboxylate transport system substrate-binding protein